MIVALWLAAAAVALGLGLPSHFAGAAQDDAAAFLPDEAESTRALEAIERVDGVEKSSFIIVYYRRHGLSDADRQGLGADKDRLEAEIGTDPVFEGVEPVTELRMSPGLDAALLVGDVQGGPESEAVPRVIEALRERFSRAEGGLRIVVTGGAAFAADAEAVFDTLNSVLLLAAGLLVVVLLVAIYRSPVFVLAPLTCVAFADLTMRSLGAGAAELGVSVNSQSTSIVSVLMLGAGTDYALLLAARYRDELRLRESPESAMAAALRGAGPAIAASVMTVVAALLCLTVAQTPSTRGLGPIAAIGVAATGLAMLTLLPAILVIAGRRAFWRPALLGWGDGIPRFGESAQDRVAAPWGRLGERIAKRPRRVWVGVAAVLAVASLGWLALDTGLTRPDGFRSDVESVEGKRLIERTFSAGAAAPTEVFLPARQIERLSAVEFAVRDHPGVEYAEWGDRMEAGVVLTALLEPDPYSQRAYELIPDLRSAVKAAGGPTVLVGGETATEYDIREAARSDAWRIVPLTLVVVLLVLAGLLRAIVGPLALMGATLLSFGASVGLSVLVFDWVLGFDGIDPSLPIFAFVFLVALGSDYNIFLITRVREEAMEHGTRDGVVRALAMTGGVITSAGVVLAGTFAVLVFLPLTFLIEMGFVIAAGILIDTFVVRSLLVPALVLDLGDRTWLPRRLRNAAG